MRLRLATAFALLFFLGLGIALHRVSRKMPERADPVSAQTFRFDPNSIDGPAAYELLTEFLKISPRDSGTEAAKAAAHFIKQVLDDASLQTAIHEFEDNTPRGRTIFRNITATIPGNSSNCIVLVSHYDTKSGIGKKFTGANDSGSSTALLLQLASRIGPSTSSVPDLVFAFVDGEECMENYSITDGLHGSRRLAKQLSGKYGTANILAVILLDMIGDSDLTVTVPQNSSPWLIQRLFDAAREEDAREKFSLYGPILDDHVPFAELGVPAIDIIDFQYGSSARMNDYWHTEQDSIDKVSAESLELIGRITVRMVNSLINTPQDRP